MAKKNFRKIPPSIRARLARLQDRDIVAGCSRTYSAADLSGGRLRHLGVELVDGRLEFPESIIPPETGGKYSDRNINGHEVVRKDLPKETHYNTVEAPDWGSDYSTHPVDLPYEKYPRDYHAPQLAAIKISSPNREAGQAEYVLVFEVDRVLNQADPDFDDDLLHCLNLLQENVGATGVQASGATFADYLQNLRIDWEVLPPGTKEEAVQRVFRNRQPTPQERSVVEERYDFLMSLKPEKLVYGMSGVQRYFGALLADDLVVFENVEYGNAIYVMFDDWRELSRRSRTELLSGRFGENFERIPHAGGWRDKLTILLQKRGWHP